MRKQNLFSALALIAAASAAPAQAPGTDTASAQAPDQVVQLPNGSLGLVSAKGVYVGQLKGSLDGPNLPDGTAAHRIFLMMPNDPTPPQPTLAQQPRGTQQPHVKPAISKQAVKSGTGRIARAALNAMGRAGMLDEQSP